MGTSANPQRSRAASHQSIPPDHLIRLRKIDAIDANIRLFIKYGFLALIAFFVYHCVDVLSGKQTFADIGMRFLGDIKIGNSFGYVVGGGGLLYGKRQKGLRERAIENLAPGLQGREAAMDPNRSSSGLTPRGRTRPEDEI